jgi:hypothetical protein
LEQLDHDLGRRIGSGIGYDRLDYFRRMAADMLIGSPVCNAYDLEKEDPCIREMYGDHMGGGQTLLLSHRPVETGVPVVQALCSASDLAGRGGGHGDTHKMYFPKMKDRLLPVFNRAVSALLTNLKMRGMLDETLIVFLTDFGRTLKINKNGGHRP